MTGSPDILIVGLGISGEAAAEYFLSDEVAADTVTVLDGNDSAELRARAERLEAKGATVTLGATGWEGHADHAIVSPGIPPTSPLYLAAEEASDQVIGEIELAYRISNSPWVAVTGTNGKTTVTSLVAHLLGFAGSPAEAVGNIGTPAVEVAREATPATTIVAEVSSFQLHAIDTFHPRAAVLLNITPDHLDWHGGMDAYASDKTRIFENMDRYDTAVIDADDPGARAVADAMAGSDVRVVRVTRSAPNTGDVGVISGSLVMNHDGRMQKICEVDELGIKGDHNVSNALAASAAALACGADLGSIRDGLASFEPIEHRLEPVGEVDGVEYFNDSKATNVDAVLKAVTAFDDRPLLLLLGGRGKGASFDDLADAAGEHARHVLAFGEAGPEIAASLESVSVDVEVTATMAEAVRRAASLGEPGDAVLLSPACASFDEFANYQERGHAFKRIVSGLAEGGPA